ncbi:MAG: hypothetical protein LUE12_07445 [Ruminococcus sp.]|nr:hypothetical protein [Ruminococcus sp.]
MLDESRVIGKVTFSIPKLGYIIKFVQLRWYFVIAIIVLIFIFFRLLRIYLEPSENKGKKAVEEQSENK